MYQMSNDPEELVECPYDKSHMIRAKRMPYHLIKCRQNSVKELAVCPFNARHEVPKAELRHHMATCPDRARLENDLAYAGAMEDGTFFKGCTDVPCYNAYEVKISENWEDEINPRPRIGVHPSFRDQVKFRDVTGYTTSQKKALLKGLDPQEESLAQERTADDINNVSDKLRLPKQTSQAYRLTQGQTEESTTPPEPNVFKFSLVNSGIGRGRGVTGQKVGGSQTAVIGLGRGRSQTYTSPFAMMAQMTHDEQVAAAVAPQAHVNSRTHTSFGDELDKVLDQELALESQTDDSRVNGQSMMWTEAPTTTTTTTTPPTTRTTAAGSWGEQRNMERGKEQQTERTVQAEEKKLTHPPRSVGRGYAGVSHLEWAAAGGLQNGHVTNGDEGGGILPPPGFFTAKKGRGVLKDSTEPDVFKPGANDINNINNTNNTNNTNNINNINNTDSCSEIRELGSGDASSALKKLQKKMRQIQKLEAMKKEGQQLTTEEIEKISKKDELLHEMDSLKLN